MLQHEAYVKMKIKRTVTAPSLIFAIQLALGFGSITPHCTNDNPDKSDKFQSSKEVTQLIAEGDISKALERLDELSKLYPNDAGYPNTIGVLLMRTGKYREAVSYFNNALRIDPDDGTIYKNLGILHYEQKEYSKAIPLLEKALELPAGDPFDILYCLGWSYRLLGKSEKSTVYFLAFSGKAPRNEKWNAKHKVAEKFLLEFSQNSDTRTSP
ncbi:MAG: tetratricopeptide repeat protein [bacterium]|nr:tetratricopeptide repeat protein [bacterium]